MREQNVICTICPVGCNITVTGSKEEVLSIEGNKCVRGIPHARAEFLNPERILTSTVRIQGYRLPVIPVRSTKPIPKDKLFEAMEEIRRITIHAPVTCGEVIARNIVDTEADIIITGY